MTNDLIRWIEERIDNDTTLDDEVGLIILAGLEGDDQLDAYLLTGEVPASVQQSPGKKLAEPARGAFLRSLHVTGFRGIGATVTLTLEPSPGLTVIAGRNGSGKSSLAEGLEVLLTGGTYRWKNKKSTQWSERWRNVHCAGSAEIVAEIVEEGSGPVRLCTRWDATTTNVNDHTTTVQRTVHGTKGPAQDAAVLGWTQQLETYRPMLSYDELGGLLESGPSELYDALAKVLGTEQLADAMARIKSRLTRMAAPQKTVTADRRALQSEAAQLDDERAHAVALLLKPTSPDTTSIRALATGVTLPDHGIIASLRELTQLQSPDTPRLGMAAQRLRSAVTAMADAGEAEASRQIARLDIRRQALRLHAEHGEQPCPVCNQGTLDDAWAQASRDRVHREAMALRELTDARFELDAARQSLQAHVRPRPASTDRAPTEDLNVAITAVRKAWDQFASVPDGDLALADHLELHAAVLSSTVGEARAIASAALADRDDRWGQLAARISTWCEAWDSYVAEKPAIDRLKAAETWLKDNDTRLKNERIAPISQAAKHAWAMLRQESNVDLGDLKLEGQATRRHVSISATVDGADTGSALAVMSQGELQALTLALFLPRASLDDSPFRFVILDDPVQAMDPSKIDGLVALLSEIAQTRQVVVFSHDDRLPAALRRSKGSARIWEVVRGPQSEVSIHPAEDPSTRYLRDGDALCMDDLVPAETLRRTLPGLLRMAIEAAARDRFYAARLVRGVSLSEVETIWNDAHGTSQRVSLAIYDDIRSLDDWLRTEYRKKGLGVATRGFHAGLYAGTAPKDAVHYARRLVEDVKGGRR